MLRLPDGMRERIKAAAERNGRSMNSEIVTTLEAAYPEPEFDVESTTMTEWLAYVDAARDAGERRNRMHEVNDLLRNSKNLYLFEICEFDDDDEWPGQIYVTMSNAHPRRDVVLKGPIVKEREIKDL